VPVKLGQSGAPDLEAAAIFSGVWTVPETEQGPLALDLAAER
jgi:hypothetical protein